MKSTLLSSGWQVRTKSSSFAETLTSKDVWRDVVIPHDAVIYRDRSASEDPAVGYVPSGQFQYRRSIRREPESAVMLLDFEGVYRDARVYLDGALIGEHAHGYTGFLVDVGTFLADDAEHELVVEARCGKDSRWYSGAGLYRPVHLLTAPDTYVTPSGIRVFTEEITGDLAIIEVAVSVASVATSIRTIDVALEIHDPDGRPVASGRTPVTLLPGESVISRQRFVVTSPQAWSAETPHLYHVAVELTTPQTTAVRETTTRDRAETTFGIRTVSVDPVRGLRVNGTEVLLRGACIHHDNGPLGSATFSASEERRVRRLKEAGFNAIRSAHHPMSIALLNACDRVGMYVLDETFDMWTSTKTLEDYSNRFTQWWESDVEAMVMKDINRPSVIMYSIGNEIPETGSPWGGILGRRIAEKIRSLDTSRPITNAVNGMLAVMDEVREMAGSFGSDISDNAGINTMMATMADLVNTIGSSDLVTDRTAESFGVLDVAGMNYLESRYETDPAIFPHRVILGTETYPMGIAKNWRLVTRLAHVIGDFTWTGWDYLGEVGIGRTQVLGPEDIATFAGPYPWISARCGDIDLIGDRRAASFYREIVFGLRHAPYVSVRPPLADGALEVNSPWSWPDGLASWNWPGHESDNMRVDVYSDADAVELLLDGSPVAHVETGPDHDFRAETTVPYRPGVLTARALRGGSPAETVELATSTTPAAITATVETLRSEHDGQNLAFIAISLDDHDGVHVHHDDRRVVVDVTGAELLAVASANPAPTVFLDGNATTMFRGRALAVVRLTSNTPATASVRVDGFETVTVDLDPAHETHHTSSLHTA